MGYTTKISDYEWERGDGPKEVPEGVDIDAKKNLAPKEHMSESEIRVDDDKVTKSKVVEADDKPAPKKSTARTKSK